MLKFVPGGIWLALNKKNVIVRPVEVLAAPTRLVFPMLQFPGEAAVPCVKKGQRVHMGQPLGIGGSFRSCTVHSSVSGRVTDLLTYNHPLTGTGTAVVVENDGKDTVYAPSSPDERPNMETATAAQTLELIREKGLVTDSLPAAPLCTFLESMAGIRTLVLNSVETEPYICRSQKMIDENPEEIALGLKCMMKCTGAKNAVLAVSGDYENEPADLLKAAHLMDLKIRLIRVPQKYPFGNENILFRLITGERLDNGRTPLKAGVGFAYAEDCLNIYRAFQYAQPQITKIITIAGDAVENPQNLEIRIGTSVHELFDHCGLTCEPERVVLGSSMRGIAVPGLSIPVVKTVSAVLALKGAGNRAVFPKCISCGKCIRVCPQRLMPNYLAVYAVKADIGKCRELKIDNCIECGACAYICPGKVPIVELIKNIKKVCG